VKLDTNTVIYDCFILYKIFLNSTKF